MDESQKRVLRIRKSILARKLQMTDDLLMDLFENGLITPQVMKVVQREKNPQTKVLKVIDCVLTRPDPDSFRCLIRVLSRDHQWAVRELQMDLRIERGQLRIEEDILAEAQVLVSRKFGGSKRICETDKKDITDMLAAKLQLQKDDWTRTQREMEGHISQLTQDVEDKSLLIHALSTQLSEFVRLHDRHLTTHAHGMLTTRDVLQAADHVVDKEVKVDVTMKKVLDRMDNILSHRDNLMKEREQCFKVIGCKKPNVPLDEAVAQCLTNAKQPPPPKISEPKPDHVTGRHVETGNSKSSAEGTKGSVESAKASRKKRKAAEPTK